MFEVLLLIFIILGFTILLYVVNKRLSSLKDNSSDKALIEWLKSMQVTMDTTNKHLNDTLQSNSSQMSRILQENARQLHERLDKASDVMKDVNKEVGKMSEIGRHMQELQDFLKSPKLRGNIGEEILNDLITQVFPKNTFNLQYQFRSGEKVDAAIKTDAGILPIDAKFPLENYQKMVKAEDEALRDAYKKDFTRDLKKHIDAISKKYILPDEGTMDFALMYIPSESVYYEVINLDAILHYARDARVYLVSPSTLYAHLQTILLSFEGKKIESKTQELFSVLRGIKIDYEKVNDNLDVLGKHITNASGQYTNVLKGFYSLGQKLESTTRLDTIHQEKLVE